MPRKKSSVSFDDRTIKIVQEFSSRYRGMDAFSALAEEIIQDYALLAARTKRELLSKFSEAELNYIYDILNSSLVMPTHSIRYSLCAEVEDADIYEHTGEKWSVSAAELSNKIKGLSEFDAYVLTKISDEFWAKQL